MTIATPRPRVLSGSERVSAPARNTVRLAVACTGPLDDARLRLAWELVGRELPGLAGTIGSCGGDYVFTHRADRGGLLTHADRAATGDALTAHLVLDALDCVAALELARTGDDAHVVSLLFRHSIADAGHGIHAFSRLWELYADLVAGQDAPPPRDPIVACSLEDALDERSVVAVDRGVLAVGSPPIHHSEPDWDGASLTGLRHGHFRLQRAVTDNLIRRCREDSISVHGAIAAAVILSLSESRTDLRQFDLTTIVDVRRHLLPPMPPVAGTTMLGYSTSTVDVAYDGAVAGIARIVLDDLERDIRSGSAQVSSVANADFRHAGATPTTLSNLGVVPAFARAQGVHFSDFSAWNEMDLAAPGSPDVLPVYGNMTLASSFGGRLRLDFFHGREMFPADWTSSQVRQVQRILSTYVTPDAPPAAVDERRYSAC